MRFADSTWLPFLAQATPLHERIAAFRREPEGDGAATRGRDAGARGEDPRVAARLARWCENAALGRWELLDRRLAWDGLSREDAATLVNGWRPDASETDLAPPSWMGTLSRTLARVRKGGLPALPSGEPPLPFDRLLAPFLAEAGERLDRRLGPGRETLGEEARRSARRSLLRRLGLAAAPTLYAEFKALRDRERSPFAPPGPEPSEASVPLPDRLYLSFVERCAAGGLAEILGRSPLLARQLATASEDWAAAIAEIVERWRADARDLEAAFDLPGEPGPIAALRLDLSDPHNGGRGVAELTAASGWKVLYKPKCLRVDAAYYRLLAWIDGTGELPPFGGLRLLPREGRGGTAPYGWMEIARAAPCAGRAAAERYYERAGRLVALVYALEGSDCHSENVIARGEQPCLIDLETLMNPAAAGLLEDTGVSPATATASRQLYDSVLRTGLLPSWTLTAEGRRIDVSMLGAGGDEEGSTTPVRVWAHPNTDRMEPRDELRPLPPRSNLPRVAAPTTDRDEAGSDAGGEAVPCEGFEPAVLRGFTGMYDFLLRRREELLGSPDLLPSWRGLRVRYVPRMTRLYGKTLRNLTRAAAARDGVAWSLDVESLCRLWTFLGERPTGWGLFEREAAALLRLDVPYFAARADGRDVHDAEGRVVLAGRFEKTPFERLEARLRSLSPEDRERQAATIRATFLARATGLRSRAPLACEPAAETLAPLAAEAGLRVAEEIGEDLLRAAVRGPGGTATWIALSPLDDSAVCQVRPIGYNLHSGAAGVGLFLAALARATGDARHEELARAALREVTRALESGAERLVAAIGLGANLGLGSILYALATAGELLDDRKLVLAAAEGARAIRDEAIAADGKLDVVFGSAGCVLALLKVHRAAGPLAGAAALDAALRCGRHLLAARRPTPQGPRSCPTMDASFHTGFSHGAAGVAAALFRLAAASGEARFAEAALEIEGWEEGLWDNGSRSFPDLRKGGGSQPAARGAYDAPATMAAWCHGVPGVALARLAHFAADGSEGARGAARRCLEATRDAAPADSDHLCCGNAGRIDVLLEGSLRLRDPRWAAAAGRLFSAVSARAARAGGFHLPTGPARAHEFPALFTGLSGLGYTGLRWARPESLPSVLLFD